MMFKHKLPGWGYVIWISWFISSDFFGTPKLHLKRYDATYSYKALSTYTLEI